MLTDLRQRLHAIRSAEMPVEQAYGVIKRKSARFSTEATGARFYCPICGAWYRSFAPFGLRGRPNARCPGCGSLERHRFLWLLHDGTAQNFTSWKPDSSRGTRGLHTAAVASRFSRSISGNRPIRRRCRCRTARPHGLALHRQCVRRGDMQPRA